MYRDFSLQQGLVCDALVTNAVFNVLTEAFKTAALCCAMVIDVVVNTGYYNCFKRLLICGYLIFVSLLSVFL